MDLVKNICKNEQRHNTYSTFQKYEHDIIVRYFMNSVPHTGFL